MISIATDGIIRDVSVVRLVFPLKLKIETKRALALVVRKKIKINIEGRNCD